MNRSKPLAIDLYCGLGGWSEGLLAEGYEVVGFDIEQHIYGEHRYPAQLVVQDVRTLHGSQFKRADLIVSSPPCQEYSYMAMPWTRAKAKAAAIRADTTGAELERLNRLFNECFRIQREACEAAGRHIPLVVENVRGAQPWVGSARWSFGSFYLWGDVPALMPPMSRAVKVGGLDWKHPNDPRHRPGQAFNPAAQGKAVVEGRKLAGFRFDGSGRSFQSASVEGVKMKDADGYERSHPNSFGWKSPRTTSSNVSARKMASAMIAKIPLPLSRHIGKTFYPDAARTEAA
jgi:hypothetical protein